MKFFNIFVRSAVKTRREGDTFSSSNVVAETMILVASTFYGYQIRDRSRHTVKKYLKDEKSHGAMKKEMFGRLG